MEGMPLNMWTYDLAREQTPTYEFMSELCRMSLDSGYDALGLYMEHRFAYPSLPWAAGQNALEPDTVKRLIREFPGLRIIPFVNLLGHLEGFLYSEQGRGLGEEVFKGLQACPSNPQVAKLASTLLSDIMSVFTDELVHLGGDETAQLAVCPACMNGEADLEQRKAELYANHFLPLINQAASAGKRVGMWGDMFLEHPSLLRKIPRETLIFDWQYFDPFDASCRKFKDAGFEVIACPTVHTYNAVWCHLTQTLENGRSARQAVESGLASGVCLTTWEMALLGNYETVLPILRILAPAAIPFNEEESEWMKLMSEELQALGGVFNFSKIRSGLKCRMLLYGNPFLTSLRHGEELCGSIGDQAMVIAEKALQISRDPSFRAAPTFLQKTIEFVRLAHRAREAYADYRPGDAASSLIPCRQIFEALESMAVANQINAGGSLADIERCKIAKRHIETVIYRVKQYGDGSLGYLPSWETITHPQFVPHDQGNWWLINRWANE